MAPCFEFPNLFQEVELFPAFGWDIDLSESLEHEMIVVVTAY